MKILIIGSGGREHAIAWKVAQSARLSKLYIAPGNPGTAACGENVALDPNDHPAIVLFCKEHGIDLVLVGPEVPLANGLADALSVCGVRCFGPSQAAAQIEASKVFAKAFMTRHAIPTARYAAFHVFDQAIAHVRSVQYPVVIKVSGLAAGKGVLLPETGEAAEAALKHIMVDQEFGAAGESVVIEERMSGEELTLLAFSDGVTVRPMLASRDHKRALDGDQGPNTGGMGAYAPVPECSSAMVEELVRVALQPCVDGLRAEGMPFVGVLYGGFMFTEAGPRVVEFNCRFGDPEAQVVLPLLETDLLDIAEACIEGRLAQLDIRWGAGAAACVVLASAGYPGAYRTGVPIRGLEAQRARALVFHSGTRASDSQIVTSGGRVLCVTGTGADIRDALGAAYAQAEAISFDGMQYRKDIGHNIVGEHS